MRKIKIGDCEYGITSCGRVYSFQAKRFMKTRFNNNGYERVNLNGTDKLVHRLVAEAYIDNPDNLPEVNHKDKNRTNNSVNNLEWCTRQENVEYRDKTEKHFSEYYKKRKRAFKNKSKTNKYSSKLLTSNNF